MIRQGVFLESSSNQNHHRPTKQLTQMNRQQNHQSRKQTLPQTPTNLQRRRTKKTNRMRKTRILTFLKRRNLPLKRRKNRKRNPIPRKVTMKMTNLKTKVHQLPLQRKIKGNLGIKTAPKTERIEILARVCQVNPLVVEVGLDREVDQEVAKDLGVDPQAGPAIDPEVETEADQEEEVQAEDDDLEDAVERQEDREDAVERQADREDAVERQADHVVDLEVGAGHQNDLVIEGVRDGVDLQGAEADPQREEVEPQNAREADADLPQTPQGGRIHAKEHPRRKRRKKGLNLLRKRRKNPRRERRKRRRKNLHQPKKKTHLRRKKTRKIRKIKIKRKKIRGRKTTLRKKKRKSDRKRRKKECRQIQSRIRKIVLNSGKRKERLATNPMMNYSVNFQFPCGVF